MPFTWTLYLRPWLRWNTGWAQPFLDNSSTPAHGGRVLWMPQYRLNVCQCPNRGCQMVTVDPTYSYFSRDFSTCCQGSTAHRCKKSSEKKFCRGDRCTIPQHHTLSTPWLCVIITQNFWTSVLYYKVQNTETLILVLDVIFEFLPIVSSTARHRLSFTGLVNGHHGVPWNPQHRSNATTSAIS